MGRPSRSARARSPRRRAPRNACRAPTTLSLAVLALLVTLALPTLAPAVIIATADGHGNVTPPADDPGWENVGKMGGLNAVYLGRGWAVTARHVASLTGFFSEDRVPLIGLARANYPTVKGSGVELRNPDGSRADVILLRITGTPELPDLPELSLAAESPTLGSPVVLVGRGRDRTSKLTYWNQLFQPATPEQFRYAGYDSSLSSSAKRWGTNEVSHVGLDARGGADLVTRAFATTFDLPGTPNEAQAARGDSGGGAFIRGAAGWQLYGVMVSVTQVPGQQDKAVFGNRTLIADLAAYAEQIRAAMNPAAAIPPEPPSPPPLGAPSRPRIQAVSP